MRARSALWWLLIALAVAIACVGNWRFAYDPGLAAGTPWWLLAMSLLAGCATFLAEADVAGNRLARWTRGECLALLSVLMLAVASRLWGISVYPPPEFFGFEEFQTGGVAYEVLQDGMWPLEFPLTNLLPVPSFWLFGPSSYTLRAPFILNGILAPVLLFLALRRVVRAAAAWAAGMLLAANCWAAAAARFADEIFFPVSIVALSLWLLVLTVQERRQVWAFGFAVVSSSLFYAYSGYRVLPPVTFAAVALIGFSGWRKGVLRAGWGRLLVLVAAVWAVLLSPGVVRSLYHDDPMLFEALDRHADAWHDTGPEDHAAVARVETALRRAYDGWKLLLIGGEGDPTVSVPGDPLFDPITGMLVSIAVVVALWRWRDPWRALMLAMVLIPFGAAGLIPLNLNVSRYFVLLVPMLTLVAFLIDDLLRWPGLPSSYSQRLVILAVGLAAVANLHALQRLTRHPAVQAAFLFPENTVLAAIHRSPAGARVVLMTLAGSNAFQPSDYSWYTTHLTGGLAESLADALALDPRDTRATYWVTQGTPEAELMPELVSLVCPNPTSTIDPATNPMATVGVVSIQSATKCHELPPVGLKATYIAEDVDGESTAAHQIDPAVMAYTIPPSLVAKLISGEVERLRVYWRGMLLPKKAGSHEVRLELMNATGHLRLAGKDLALRPDPETSEIAAVRVEMDRNPAPLGIELDAAVGRRPLVRLYWVPPGEPLQLVPPTHLRPIASG